MKWWAWIYFGFYGLLSLLSIYKEIRLRTEPLWFLALMIVGEVCIVTAALAYWFPAIRAATGALLFNIYALGLVFAAVQANRTFRKDVFGDPDLARKGKLFVGLVGVALVAIVGGPALVWGFIAAVLGRGSA